MRQKRPNYRQAPLKGISRQMISEISRRLVAYGPVTEMTYVGLGGLEFVDFAVLYDSLGLASMYSIEDREPRERVDFNRPSHSIVNLEGTTNQRLPEIDDLGTRRSIVWLDYLSSMSLPVQQDLAYLAGKLLPGSAIFVTLNAHYVESDDFAKVREGFGDYWDDYKPKDFLAWGRASLQMSAAETVMNRALIPRLGSAALLRVLDLQYQDSARMQVGGWIVTEDPADTAEKCRFAELEFTAQARAGTPVRLAWPDLTPGEWNWLHRQMPVANVLDLAKPHDYVSDQTLEDFASVHRYARRRLTSAAG